METRWDWLNTHHSYSSFHNGLEKKLPYTQQEYTTLIFYNWDHSVPSSNSSSRFPFGGGGGLGKNPMRASSHNDALSHTLETCQYSLMSLGTEKPKDPSPPSFCNSHVAVHPYLVLFLVSFPGWIPRKQWTKRFLLFNNSWMDFNTAFGRYYKMAPEEEVCYCIPSPHSSLVSFPYRALVYRVAVGRQGEPQLIYCLDLSWLTWLSTIYNT